VARWLLRGGVAATLPLDAYVHAEHARNYDFNGSTISEGSIFRIEAGAARTVDNHTSASVDAVNVVSDRYRIPSGPT